MAKRLFAPNKKQFANPLCDECDLRLVDWVKTRNMDPSGKGRKGVLIIPEAPGPEEDIEGTQLVGNAGQRARRPLLRNGFDMDLDARKLNSINCYPGKDSKGKFKKPTKNQLFCCKPKIDKEIEDFKPKYIWLFGGSAVEQIYGSKFKSKKLSITGWRGLTIADVGLNAWALPMFHPSYPARNEKDINLNTVFDNDIKGAVEFIETHPDRPVPLNPENNVDIITDLQELEHKLTKLLDRRPITAFDYECSALKPYREGQVIHCMSISDEERSLAFPIYKPDSLASPPFLDPSKFFWPEKAFKRVKQLVRFYLEDEKMKKVAHNAKFEQCWGSEILKTEAKGIIACTMNDQHILDDRAGITGLKFQGFVRWGVSEYEKEFDAYIDKGSKVSGNAFNRLHHMPTDKLLLYNGIDSFLTLKLYNEQKEEFKLRERSLSNCSKKLFLPGALAFSETEQEGICIKEGYFEEKEQEIEDNIKEALQVLNDSMEAKKFLDIKKKAPKWSSSIDVAYIFYDLLKLDPPKETTGGGRSVDEDALQTLSKEHDIPIINALLKYRKLGKLKNTYIAQFLREKWDNKIHPMINLNIARTGRSSMQRPNFQNVPVREKTAKAIMRKGVIPSPGNKIAEPDYSGIEVRLLCCHTKDPELIRYINDPTTDMHRDQSQRLFLLESWQVDWYLRFYSKNGFVFPSVYGSYWRNTAKNLWKECKNLNILRRKDDKKKPTGPTVKEWLYSKGIRNYSDFEAHVKDEERMFWDRFHVTKEWQDKVRADFLQKGYTTSFFGFERGGYLKDEVLNAAVQGDAFHCLLWSYIQTNNIRKKEGWLTKLIGEIHDSIIIDLHPDEQNHVFHTVKWIMEEEIKVGRPWIIVPLKVDFEVTGIDEPWYSKEELTV